MTISRGMILITMLSAAAGSGFSDPLASSDPASSEASSQAMAPAANPRQDSSAAARHNACIKRCDIAESNCSSNVRGATKQCMKLAATGGVDPWTMRREYAGYYCGYFRGDHCYGAYDRQQCLNRYALRLSACTDWFRDNIAKEYFDCRSSERESLVLCRDELRDCHAACDE